MEIKNKVVVITGSSKGLGKGLAYAFSKRGAKVVLNARQKDELEKVAQDLQTIFVVGDVSKEQDVINLAAETIKQFGQIDIWINNAGLWMAPASLETIDWEKARQIIEVNLFGTMYGTKAALTQMRKQGQGIIMNILSTSALEGRAKSSAYGASKFGALGFTKSIRKETDGSEIKIMAVFPGGMQTNLFDAQKPDDINTFMSFDSVAEKIVQNLQQDNPEEDLIIRRPGA